MVRIRKFKDPVAVYVIFLLLQFYRNLVAQYVLAEQRRPRHASDGTTRHSGAAHLAVG